MSRTGLSDLPLHGGDAPRWLFTRMVSLAEAITEVVIDEYGTNELLRRMADPFWFQAYSCVLGFDWHSSGTTTVTCGAMKEALRTCPDIGVAGGKGAVSRRAPAEIETWCLGKNLSGSRTAGLIRASKLSAKVDSAAVQDGHDLYHHVILFDREGNWSVVQQGMNERSGYARRYQWSSVEVSSFVEEPHTGILGTRNADVLDMTSRSSSMSRSVSVDLVKDGVEHLRHDILVVEKGQSTIDDFAGLRSKKLHMPRDVNWDVLSRAYEIQPTDYEGLLGIAGIGPSTVRALALIGELIYGTEPSWKDPVKYSFTVGGKDGVPYPVDRKAMDRSIELLRAGIDESRAGDREKLQAVQRLRRFVPPDIGSRGLDGLR